MTVNAPVAEIHLDHIRANFEYAKSLAPDSKTMPVIKANAYGHGVQQVCEILTDANALAVARVLEGIDLRRFAPNQEIVILEGYLGSIERDMCVEYKLTPVIHSKHQLKLLPPDLPHWLKFNTGMFRLGFLPDQAEALASRLSKSSLIGICSHLANSEVSAHPLNQEQMARFKSACEYFPGVDYSFANSGGILGDNGFALDWVRPGLMLYGGAPAGESLSELKPGMTLRAPVVAVNQLKVGDRVGYGSTWTAEQDCRLAVVALGYADGYPREMPTGSPVLVNGRRRQLVGRVSMDMCTVLLEDGDETNQGDWVTFWGAELPIDEVAECCGTISYTLMTGLGSRVQRQFSKG